MNDSEEPHSISPGPKFESTHTAYKRGLGGTEWKDRQIQDATSHREDSEGKRLPADGGVSIMPGRGQSIKNVQGIAAAIKVYDGGVESGDLTLRLVRD